MPYHFTNKKQNRSPENGQAIVEFAIVFPVLMLLLIGIFEAGRMVFLYAAVTNASREAARYASAIGFDANTSYRKYQYCDGIRTTAKKSAFRYVDDSDIQIAYDTGPGTNATVKCPVGTVSDTTIAPYMGRDRVKVTVIAHYKPITRLVPFPERDFTSVSYRTILGYVALTSTPVAGGGGGGGGGGGSNTSTPTATSTSLLPTTFPTSTSTLLNTFTPTATFTATATNGPASTNTPIPTNTITALPSPTATNGPVSTNTPIPTKTSTALPSATATWTNTATPTLTLTPTNTLTPTATPVCQSPTASKIAVSNASMSTQVTNPNGVAVTLTNVVVKWDKKIGSTNVNVKSVTFNGVTIWTGTDNSGSLPITTSQTILAGATPTLLVTFDASYTNGRANMTSIAMTFTQTGCSGTYTVTATP